MGSLVSYAETNLRFLLRELEPILANRDLTDLWINGPGNAFVDRGRGRERIDLPYSFADLEYIAINAAAFTKQDVGEAEPLVSTSLPDGHRVNIARPPAVAHGQYAFSIRQPKAITWTPEDLENAGVFSKTRTGGPKHRGASDELSRLYANRQWRRFLEAAVRAGLNIVFSGRVGTGKTHLMRSVTHCIPPMWRIITIEDVQELINLPCENVVHMLYSKGGQSAARVTAKDLVEAAMRMGMDGLLIQELRDSAAYAYYDALKSGHWVMTTTHADSAEDTIPRIAGLVREHPSGNGKSQKETAEELSRLIDVVVHCVRDGDHRYVEQVWYRAAA